MLKKDTKIKWNSKAKKSFSQVKIALTTALVLMSPNFTKDFMIFSFAFDHTIAVVYYRRAAKDKSNQ